MIHVLGDEDEKEESKLSKNNNSKHNYSKYSSTKKPAEVKEVAKEVTPAAEAKKPVIESAPAPVVEQMRFIPVEGVVVDCTKLNVRTRPAPGASVVTTIDVNTTVGINVEKSTNEWFYICAASGVEGYCMRKYIKSDL
jgi:uncharacterized protein YgiM (DUF1202 family)